MEKILKNKANALLLLIVISLFFVLPLFENNFYLSHDGEAQVARFGAYIKSFLDNQIPIRWAGDLNYRYGSPALNFYYPLPGLLSIPFHLLGLSLENIFKLIIIFSFTFSFISFYLWTKNFLRKEAAFAGALLYGLSPYHFLNMYVRGDVAELLAYAFAPLVFLFIDKTIKERNILNIILGAIFYALLILSHNFVSLIFSPILLFYSLFKSKNFNQFALCLPIFLGGLVISSFFWLPAIIESQFVNAKLFIGDNFKDHFLSVNKLIFSDWGFGPDVNEKGGQSPQIGIIGFIIFIISLIFKKSRDYKFWVIILFVSIFLTLSTSASIWNSVSLLKLSEFPWRFLGISSFAISVIGTIALNEIKNKKIIYLLCLIVFVTSIYYVKIEKIEPKPDSFYFDYKGTTSFHGETSSIWTAGDFYEVPKNSIEIIGGKGKILQISRKSNIHKFIIEAVTDTIILDNTVYFPGWRAEIDGRKVPIEFQDPSNRGLITFKVPSGKHAISIIFGESPIRLASNYLSILGLAFLILVLFLRKKVNKIIRQ